MTTLMSDLQRKLRDEAIEEIRQIFHKTRHTDKIRLDPDLVAKLLGYTARDEEYKREREKENADYLRRQRDNDDAVTNAIVTGVIVESILSSTPDPAPSIPDSAPSSDFSGGGGDFGGGGSDSSF